MRIVIAEDLALLRDGLIRLFTAHGFDVVRIDHGWCTSIYANDPNGIMVEFCSTTRAFTEDDHRRAQELVSAEQPPVNRGEPPMQFFEARSRDDATVS